MAVSSAKIWNKSLTLLFICMFALLALSAWSQKQRPEMKLILTYRKTSVPSPLIRFIRLRRTTK